MKKILVSIALLGMAIGANAALTFDLSTVMSGATPGGTPPWLRATFTQSGNDVLLKMEALNLVTSPNVEAVDDWAFNLNPNILASTLTAVESSRSGAFAAVGFASSPNLGYAGFSFDFGFGYPNPVGGDAIANRFTQGDSITFTISRNGGLSVSDFNYTAEKNGLEIFTAAHIISIGENGKGSAFVGAPVPEPSTIIAGALLLIPFAGSMLRFIPKRRA